MDNQKVSTMDQCQMAIEALERAETAPPLMVLREADLALRAAVNMRDTLIAQLREDDSAAAPRVRTALDRVNVALSLMVGLEYPTGGIVRDAAKQARTVLQSLLDEGLLGQSEEKNEQAHNQT